ncbi:GNAT family N-acetyltransferase [Microbacterium sp.]|uniref:GNAT family N-acetyltransferase n=1 Tax=Microbacterium sp. TaxID=51671 RepID=UPI0028113C75|nr:GNAT family N-acetyltransferase [Microbacterium sp.]
MSIPLPAGATLHPLELPARADAGTSPLIREYAAVRNATILESTGRDDDALTAEELLPTLYTTPDQERRQWYVELDGRIVGCCALDILKDDGGRMALAIVALLDEVAGRGIGSAAYAHVERIARDAGVRSLLHWSEHHDDGPGRTPLASPTGFGTVPADRSARFLAANGYRLEQVERASALVWTDGTAAHLSALRDEAARHATEYRVVQWTLPTPSEWVEGYAWMKSRMSTDVPDADLGLPEEVWDADRVARHEERYAQKGWTVLVTAAQHVGTGELCAFNELAMTAANPASATHQHDTLVLADHRGHRLGMLVKTAGLLGWRQRHPLSPKVITYNAEENRPMLSINEAIGFTPVAYEGAWKKDLT